MKGNPGAEEYVGWEFRNRAVIFRPGTAVYFCDLRGALIEGLDLTGVQFVGCRLNGASFQGSRIVSGRFEGCFSADEFSPLNLKDCRLSQTEFVDCHLHHIGDRLVEGVTWPPELEKAASRTLASRNDARFAGVVELHRISDCRSLPILASVLVNDEWEVKAEAIRTISEMRDCIQHRWSRQLMQLLFINLGAEWALLREAAAEQLPVLAPDDDVLARVIATITDQEDDMKLVGLRAAHLLAKLDQRYAALIPLQAVYQGLQSEQIDVRTESVRIAGLLDDPDGNLENKLRDTSPQVRLAALQEMFSLSKMPPRAVVARLLKDPDDGVRTQALRIIHGIYHLTKRELERARTDPSPSVRQAAELIGKTKQNERADQY